MHTPQAIPYNIHTSADITSTTRSNALLTPHTSLPLVNKLYTLASSKHAAPTSNKSKALA